MSGSGTMRTVLSDAEGKKESISAITSALGNANDEAKKSDLKGGKKQKGKK
jgi:hypothetical protein